MFQISKMEAFLGKWKMDYDACEGYDEFMTAEVNKIVIKCKPRLTLYVHPYNTATAKQSSYKPTTTNTSLILLGLLFPFKD